MDELLEGVLLEWTSTPSAPHTCCSICPALPGGSSSSWSTEDAGQGVTWVFLEHRVVSPEGPMDIVGASWEI